MNWKDWIRNSEGLLERYTRSCQKWLGLNDYQMMWLMWWDGFIAGIILWLIFG